MRLQPTGNGFVIDAADLGAQLGLAAAEVPRLMREGQITSLSETGEGEDAGRFRVTFCYETIRLRLTVDAAGEVLQQRRTGFVRGTATPARPRARAQPSAAKSARPTET